MMLERIFICMQQLEARNCKRYSFALKNGIQFIQKENKRINVLLHIIELYINLHHFLFILCP